MNGGTVPDFHHTFEPGGTSSLGATADLTIREIEDAGIREILQTPGVALGNWGLLGALLDPGNPYFVFREPLGQAREVKTAVSGLFGRFVARAYAMRHLGYSHFYHIQRLPMRLTGPTGGRVERVAGTRGDLPDWVVWSRACGLGIIEAKGCHDTKGPGAALTRAYNQAGRAEITIRGRRPTLKRYAIATRWGFAPPSTMTPMLAVRDPEVEGEGVTPEEVEALGLGVVRHHYASILRSLGYGDLSRALVQLATARFANQRTQALAAARTALETSKVSRVEVDVGVAPKDVLVGGVVIRDRLLIDTDLSIADQQTLARLQMRPTFVGIERSALRAAIEGSIEESGDKTTALVSETDISELSPRDEGVNDWVIRLDEDRARLI
jgi:hypothetical protein